MVKWSLPNYTTILTYVYLKWNSEYDITRNRNDAWKNSASPSLIDRSRRRNGIEITIELKTLSIYFSIISTTANRTSLQFIWSTCFKTPKLVGGLIMELPNWIHPPKVRESIAGIRVVEEKRYLLWSAEQGAKQLSLNSWALQEVRSEDSYSLELGLKGTWSALAQVSGCLVGPVAFLWLGIYDGQVSFSWSGSSMQVQFRDLEFPI